MKKQFLTMLVSFCVAVTAFAGGGQEGPERPRDQGATGERIEIHLEPGPHYSKRVNAFLFFGYTVYPQVAVWIQTQDSEYIQTLYVTQAAAEGNYSFAPEEGRPEALPVWSGIQEQNIDAVSSATSTDTAVSYGSSLVSQLEPGTYLIKLETNRSYDWNETYTEENSGVNGQPSLIYQAELTIGRGEDTAEFDLIGTGSVDGSGSVIHSGLDGIDTALGLFSVMEVRYIPEQR
ncbi:MAG: hypothetical protein ACLFR1_01445 [Spirochaetia bacterium]